MNLVTWQPPLNVGFAINHDEPLDLNPVNLIQLIPIPLNVGRYSST